MERRGSAVPIPSGPLQTDSLRPPAGQLARLIWRFSIAVNRALITYREPILDMQLVQERIANIATDLFASSCVLSRWDAETQAGRRNGDSASPNHLPAELFLRQSFRRIRGWVADL